jgi:hypothetical protein
MMFMSNFDGLVFSGVRSSEDDQVRVATKRRFGELPATFDQTGFVDHVSELFRVLHAQNSEREWCVFPAYNSQFFTVGGTQITGSAVIGTGKNSVSNLNPSITHTDGTDTFYIADPLNRGLLDFVEVSIRRGDQPLVTTVIGSLDQFFGDSGKCVLSSSDLTTYFGGGLSKERGDTIISVTYQLKESGFFWSQNDETQTRFQFSTAKNRVTLIPGTAPISLGALLPDQNYTLEYVPKEATANQFLRGDSGNADSFSYFRMGANPTADSSTAVRVLAVEEISESLFTSNPTAQGQLEVSTGTLLWKSTFVEQNQGKSLWFVPSEVQTSYTGRVGSLQETLVISPVPYPFERPMLRVDSRTYLNPILLGDDAALASWTPADATQVGVSLTTGRCKLPEYWLNKANPDHPDYDIHYFGASLFYDGLVMNLNPCGLVDPVVVTSPSGDELESGKTFYLRNAELSASGVERLYDNYGLIPTSGDGSFRPLGDTTTTHDGVTRHIENGLFYTRNKPFTTIEVKKAASDLSAFEFQVKAGHVEVAIIPDPNGSQLALSLEDLQDQQGEFLYYKNLELTPSVYLTEPTLFSLFKTSYTITGEESFTFFVDGSSYTWLGSSLGEGTYTAEQLAASIDAVISGTGSCDDFRGYIRLSGQVSVEIGSDAPANIGFPSFWRVEPSQDLNWVVYAPVRFVFDSNLDTTSLDVVAYAVVESELQSEVRNFPFSFLTDLPLRDFFGFDQDVFLALENPQSVQTLLRHNENAQYLFETLGRVDYTGWQDVSYRVLQPQTNLNLNNTNSFYEASLLEENDGYVKVTNSSGVLETRDSFVVENNSVLLTDTYGEKILSGFQGSLTRDSAVLTDLEQDFSSVPVNSRISVGSYGFFYVEEILTATTVRLDTPPLSSENPGDPASVGQLRYDIYEGSEVYDPAQVVLGQYETISAFAEEPFQISWLYQITDSFPKVLDSTKTYSLRIGEDPVVLTTLEKTSVGVVTSGLVLPASIDKTRITKDRFSIQIGKTTFTLGVDLFRVDTFPSSLDSNSVYLRNTFYDLQFGESVLTEHQNQDVFYVPEYLTDLSEGFAETKKGSTSFQLSAVDAAKTETRFLVEQWSMDQVFASPIEGIFTFPETAPEGVQVEVSYYPATTGGDKASEILVTEKLPSTKQLETCTRVDAFTYSFNPDGKTLSEGSYSIFVGATLQNYEATTCFVDEENSLIEFFSEIPVGETVRISYSVLETFGGERTFLTSQKPIYRKPLVIEKGSTAFVLDGDRTGQFVAEHLFRVDNSLFYVDSSSFSDGKTTVTIETAPFLDTGSRSPGQDSVLLMSDRPVKNVTRFYRTVAAVVEPFHAEQDFLLLEGDFTSLLVAGYVLELNGVPYLVRQTELVQTKTRISLFLPLGQNQSDSTILKFSTVPVYPSGTSQVLIPSGVRRDGLSFVRKVDGEPGVEDTSFVVQDGVVTFTTPLKPLEQVFLHGTSGLVVQPTLEDDVVFVPTVSFRYQQTQPLETSNSLKGLFLTYKPQTWYTSLQKISRWVNGTQNVLTGRVNTYTQKQDALAQDVAHRRLFDTYQVLVSALEGLESQRTGSVIESLAWLYQSQESNPSFGGEDFYTLEYISPKAIFYVFNQLKTLAYPTNPVTIDEGDVVTTPDTYTLADGVVSGTEAGTSLLDSLISSQSSLNDVEGISLVRATEGGAELVPSYETSVRSRLYNQALKAFFAAFSFELDRFTYESYVNNTRVSSYQKPIAVVENKTEGQLTNIASLSLMDRKPRARVVEYNKNGLPSYVPSTEGKPALLLSLLRDEEWGFDTTTNLWDLSLLSAQGGDLADLSTGYESYRIPAFNTDQQVMVYTRDGVVYTVADSATILSNNRLGSVFVHTVYQGCVATFKGLDGAEITDSSRLVLLTSAQETLPFVLERSDTIFLIPATGTNETFSDPPTQEDLQRAASNQTTYRLGFDVDVDLVNGMVIDRSLPSFQDPSLLGLQEILGQKSITPGAFLEAHVLKTPTEVRNLPALGGGWQDDDGDVPFPYRDLPYSEVTLLQRVEAALKDLLATQSVDTTQYVYPDEIVFEDGEVLELFDGTFPPATLLTSVDALPVTNGSVEPGIGDVRASDLGLIEVDDTETRVPAGGQGFFQISNVSYNGSENTSLVEAARFPTPTTKGDRLRYEVQNAMTHIGGGGVAGMIITEAGGNTLFDVSSANGVSGLVLNDGLVGTNGGLNNLFTFPTFPNNNMITIKLFNNAGTLIETILIQGAGATGGAGAAILGSAPTATSTILTLPNISIVSSVGAIYDFTISVDVVDDPLTLTTGSQTAQVLSDRLTFEEELDFSTALPRGSETDAAVSVETTLVVHTVTVGSDTDVTVNKLHSGVPLSFLPRTSATSYGVFEQVGSFSGGVGSLKVMSFEGSTNTPVLAKPGQTLKGLLMPSASKDDQTPDANGVICTATGKCSGTLSAYQNRLTEITSVTGALSKVRSGDLLVVNQTPSVFHGTYLVRHVVEPTTSLYKEVLMTTTAGSGGGFLPFVFPKLVGWDAGVPEITVSGIAEGVSFPSSGRVYVVLDEDQIHSGSPTTDFVYSAAYSSITGGENFSGLSDYRDADNSVITQNDFFAALREGVRVSGFATMEVSFENTSSLPDNNVVGYSGGSSVKGFSNVIFYRSTGSSEKLFSSATISTTPVASQLGVTVKSRYTTPHLYTGLDVAWFDDVPESLDVSNFVTADWQLIHDQSLSGINCILPSTVIKTSDTKTGGGAKFFAQSGVFLEPSFPNSLRDFNTQRHLVDISHNNPAGTVGMMDETTFGASGVSPETVTFEVRRLRRFQTFDLTDSIQQLQLLYETPKGFIETVGNLGYRTTSKQFAYVVAQGDGTQLGGFVTLGLKSGDYFCLLSESGDLLEKRLIIKVVSNTELLIQAPGLVTPNPEERPFEIQRTSGVKPQEQSYKEILSAAFDVVFSREADYVNQTGGYVDTAEVNQLRDDAFSGSNFTEVGVLSGDIVVVDPAGEVRGSGGVPSTGVERGASPKGDRSIVDRSVFQTGAVSNLDDNRGFYKVSSVSETVLEVESHSFASQRSGTDVVYPLDASQRASYGYAFYPTVGNSSLPSLTEEGQNDLRPTALADVGNSFNSDNYSIRPFGYQILRPSGLLSSSTVDFLLMSRERFLTWLETCQLNLFTAQTGTYQGFQDLEQSSSFGGVFSNEAINQIRGYVSETPFTNNDECLSILDRRFFLMDSSLSYSSHADFTDVNNKSVRPLFSDLLQGTYQRDQLREYRRLYLNKRLDVYAGTIRHLIRLTETIQEEREGKVASLLETKIKRNL